jgi:polyisoprenoid-binding protein YceI
MRSAFLPLLALVAFPAFGNESYTIDPAHSYPVFEVGHNGISTFRGKFERMQGKITLDRAARTGTIDVDIDVSSIDTGHAVRDNVLKGENWFNAAAFPTMSYKSSSLKFNGEEVVGADGQLTLHGVTRPVPLTVQAFRCRVLNNEREVCGADARATIKRSEFGLTRSTNSVGDDVTIMVSFEAAKG